MFNNKSLLILVGAMSLSFGTSAEDEQVKCYGVAPAGTSNCGYASHADEKNSCQSKSELDCEWSTWVFVDSKEECDKMGGIVGEEAAKLASNVEGEILGEKDSQERAVNHNCKLLKDRKNSDESEVVHSLEKNIIKPSENDHNEKPSQPEKKSWFQRLFG
ncbi:MAG: hypothetical protein CMM87_02575 [Rickettsiales bacterium]|nr:hypothetical protein [Rickettsiales bacterium]|tara:strand:- start:28674 stop:29153 length:480 start_codon:yes stop_codon:yes gene_type:complete